jgi:ABC-2 type transport system ATP-binding protein
VLEAIRTTRRFGDRVALAELDLVVGCGEVVALLGANGAGKSTTIALFLGLIRPTSGEVRVAGRSVAEDPTRARRLLAYVPEAAALFPALSGVETLQFFAELAGDPVPAADEACAALVAAGLPREAADRRVATYSKGMRQKTALAVAVARGAKALVLDEPLSGLDPVAAIGTSETIRTRARAGAAVLMATHDLFRAHDIADRIVILREGRVVARTTPAELDPRGLEALYVQHMRGAAP